MSVEALIGQLNKDQQQFVFYSDEHEGKARKLEQNGDLDGAAASLGKAKVNAQFALDIQTVLDQHAEQSKFLDITTLQTLQDYRFGTFVKGEQFAFARGLTISPTHLPAALDAMVADGWDLLSIFGKTDSANIGFIFKRKEDSRVKELLAANNAEVERRRAAERELRELKTRLQDDGK